MCMKKFHIFGMVMILPIGNCCWGFPGGSDGKESACNAQDLGSVPGLEGSPGEGNGYLQHSGLENSMDCIVYGVSKSPWGCKEISYGISLSLSD